MLFYTIWKYLSVHLAIGRPLRGCQKLLMLNKELTDLDATGKVILDHIYDQKTPVHFYNLLSKLDYCIPELAKPIFSQLISFIKSQTKHDTIKVIDLGCSYGVNGALLKSGKNFQDLFERYQNNELKNKSSDDIILLDKNWYDGLTKATKIIGVDISRPALNYATETQLIDGKLLGNFENRDLSEAESAVVENTDLIISTGCIGYVGHKTISTILKAITTKQPLMAHFVLRTFAFDEIMNLLGHHGYQTHKSKAPFRQRRFATKAEKLSTLKRLSEMDVDVEGFEDDGWYYADLFLSLPPGCDFSSLPEGMQNIFKI